MSNLEQSPAWQALNQHQRWTARLHMRDLFAADPSALNTSPCTWMISSSIISKNRITEKTLPLLIELARQAGLPEKIEAMFTGREDQHH